MIKKFKKPQDPDKKRSGKVIKIGKKKLTIKKVIKKKAGANKNSVNSSQDPIRVKFAKQAKIKKIVIIGLSACVVIGLIGFGLMITWMIQAPPLNIDKFNFTASTMVYDINGNPYQELQAVETRIPVSIDTIPEIVQLSFISIEDQRFYTHNGIDIRGTGKAILSVLFSGSTEGPGGSTITQQLIKQTHLTSAVSIKRKVMEWKLAYQLEQKMDKREILEAYLNKVNMSITWGIQSASKAYFGKDVTQLSIAQSAVLASIINSPTFYNPYDYEQDADGNNYIVKTTDANGVVTIGYDKDNQQRALMVIDKMLQLGNINQQEYDIAKNELENNLIGLVMPNVSTTYTYFTDAVYTQVLNDIMQKYNYTSDAATNLILNGGLKIYSTVDPLIQKALEDQAADPNNFPSASSQANAASAAATASTGEEVKYIPQLGGAVIENATGYVSGIIGGREKTASLTMNRALRQFQIGSTTKPLTVYAPGIDTGVLTLGTTFYNAPLNFGGWRVVNTPSTYTGMTTCRQAIAGSINIIAVLAQKKVGVDVSADYAEKFGLTIARNGEMNDMNSAALALGGYTYGQTPLAVASAYTVFPNNGYRVTPTFYTKVEDSKGTTILTATQNTVQVLTDGTAYIVTSALKDVVRGGTTSRSIPGQEIGGKTGTTDSEACTWFTGFTSKYTASFWWGYDANKVTVGDTTYTLLIGMGGGGSRSPAQYWERVFRQFYSAKNLPSASLPSPPDSVISAPIDGVSGKAPTELSAQDPRGSKVYSEYFLKGFYPSESDDMHVKVTICKDTGLLANEYCPNTETKVMLVRDLTKLLPEGCSLVNPSFFTADEAPLIAPTTTCTVHTSEDVITGFEFSTSDTSNQIINSLTIDEGTTKMLYLKTVSPKGIKPLTYETPTYTSSDEKIVKVTATAKGVSVQGIAEGTAQITATYVYNIGGTPRTISRTISVTVKKVVIPKP